VVVGLVHASTMRPTVAAVVAGFPSRLVAVAVPIALAVVRIAIVLALLAGSVVGPHRGVATDGELGLAGEKSS
jgi:hypothetical protein